MKSEREFLNGMWWKVNILEYEELEKAHVKAFNRRLTIKAIGTVIFPIIAFLFVILCPQFVIDSIYLLTIGILSIAFIFEYLSTNTLEDKNYGNCDI
ncbi:MAG: hypothetical protein KID00_05935 [Clostridium argentinense]|uniref:Uncharacterized protein n=1 Tax=Clostridium faecium TaxID=2762223 RepID=A0ABR8YUE3_9CLOT|nr:hypothetical protein [Clostridium faecium]MBD8047860.1 hypothetical protein [Clostridium faecium]MBS5823388.1 hypothetical protein [Clostridium argentinense]MDU1349405.1 hypothetical protein [Clostridium argentinense]